MLLTPSVTSWSFRKQVKQLYAGYLPAAQTKRAPKKSRRSTKHRLFDLRWLPIVTLTCFALNMQ
uniref:Uncharacterized protein n=1 Tax=Xiphophorus maculatus TaxID=8083 RepID=A0A3B5Q9H1_XIPMA